MKKYLSTFILRLKLETTYRAAAIGGIVCQAFFGLILIELYIALYETKPQSMPLSSVVTYVWIQQACFRILFSSENDLFEQIRTGDFAYALVRPINQYFYWFMRSLAQRLTGGFFRSLPMVIIAFLLPAPYRLSMPFSFFHLCLFLFSLFLGIVVVCALDNIASGLTMKSLDARGIKSILTMLMMTLSGNILPLTLFPDTWQNVLSYFPYTQILDTPIRLYTGLTAPSFLLKSLIVQISWCVLLVFIGHFIWQKNIQRITIMGG